MTNERLKTGFRDRLNDPAGDPERAPVSAGPHTGPERRDGPRTQTRLAGKIVSGDGFLSPDCVVIDLSRNGARVRISGAVTLPPPVALLLVGERLLFDAAIAWRRGDETGLVFTAPHDLRTDGRRAPTGLRALLAELGLRRSRAPRTRRRAERLD